MLSIHRRWIYSRCLGRPFLTAANTVRSGLRYQSSTSSDSISPILLDRARSIASEYEKLSDRNAENYDVGIAKKIGELGPVTTALKDWEDAQHSLTELNTILKDPTSDNELRTLAQTDIESTNVSISKLNRRLKYALIPRHQFANLPCLIEIHPGAGGSEASLFAHTLLNMYISLCNRLNWPYEITSYTPDDSVAETQGEGLTDAVLEVNYAGSYDLLRTEAGVHRVQRVPATEKKGRTHTSAVSVLVLPAFPDNPSVSSGGESNKEISIEDPSSDFYIAPNEVRSETMRARGAGGQHVNKTDSAIRLTHIPTGIVVAMQESRSQHKNREKAWRILRSKLAAKRKEDRDAELLALRRNVMGGQARTGGREDKIRTYNFSQTRVTDHRCGVDTADLDGVLEGSEALSLLMQGVREWNDENEIRNLMFDESDKA